jgi:uncharacterized membrane protein YciS (DUF1049 family)
MSLIRAEARRLAKRRVTRFMLAFVVLALAVIAVSFIFASEKIGPEQQAAAVAEAQQQEQEQVRSAEQERAQCEAAKKSGTPDPRFPADMDCSVITPPPAGTVDPAWFLPYQFDFRKDFGTFISVFAGVLGLFAFIVGASYVGAEWSTGGMMNLLLWRPRRLSVLLTKLGVLLGAVLGIGVVLGALWTAIFWLIGRYDGVTGRMTQGVWESFALTGLRGIGLALAMAAAAFGLASLGRHTAMALGAAVGVGVVSEIGLRIALLIAQVKFPDRYALSTYALAWFEKKWKLEDYNACNFTNGECLPATFTVTWQQSAAVFGIGTAVILAAALWSMRSRDIT